MLLLLVGADLDQSKGDEWVELVTSQLQRLSGESLLVTDHHSDPKLLGATGSVVVTREPVTAATRSAAALASGALRMGHDGSEALRERLGWTRPSSRGRPIQLLVVTDGEVDEAALEQGAEAQGVTVLPPEPTGTKARRAVAKVAKRELLPLAATAVRADPDDAATHTPVAAAAAVGWLADTLSLEGLEEVTVRGGEFTRLRFSDGSIKQVAPLAHSESELVGRMRTLAEVGEPDRPVRFDENRQVFDVQVAGRWRAHGEAWATRPAVLVLRSNLGTAAADLNRLDVCDPRLAALLVEAVAGASRLNVVIGAPMGAGKTTLAQALLAQVPHDERIDTIEDTPELRLATYGLHPDTYERLTSESNVEGVGRVPMSEHIRRAKRADTAKLVVGEVRGEGTLALLDAMSSGLLGCVVTVHAPAGGIVPKLIAYGTTEGASHEHVAREVAAAVNLTVWLTRGHDGRRRIGEVAQLTGFNDETGYPSLRTLWELTDGRPHAEPLGEPEGLVADTYRSVGLDLEGAWVERPEPST